MGYHCAEILSRIHCPLRYAILGNHDFLVGAHAITDALLTHGIPVLANNSVALERDGRRLWLAGTQDALEGRPNLHATLPAGRNAEPLILLVHEPDFADHAVGRQISLLLSEYPRRPGSSPLSAPAPSP